MTKKEFWEKTKEAEKEYKRLSEHCNKCNGNFNDDCVDCEDFEKREIAREIFESYKKELSEKYNLNYDKFNEFVETIKKDDIYDDMSESQNNNLKLYTQNDLEIKDKEIEDWRNRYRYLQADLDNIKKRYNIQIDNITKYEGENIFKDLLEIFDNLDYSANDDIDILITYNNLLKLFKKYGVELIYKEERPIFFNHEYDEAITSVNTDDPKLDNSINKVYQKGFFFKDKILRYEKVIVNKYND